MQKLLSVPYSHQLADGYCLAACAQMVLAFQNVDQSQIDLAVRLRIRPALGTAARHIRHLVNDHTNINFGEGTLVELQRWV